jgi:alkaline phosphatase isozyme conversion protein
MLRRRWMAIALVAIVVIAAVALAAAVQTKPITAAGETPRPAASAAMDAYDYMAALSDDIGSRVAGRSGEQKAGQYIVSELTAFGYAPQTLPFSFTSGGSTLTSANIVAVKPGTDAAGKQIVIGAHYDSVAVGRGAFDNGSGIGLLLALAQQLYAQPTPYTLVFVAFGAEEAGLKGSSRYVSAQMTAEEKADTVLMINFDSVATGDQLYCYSGSGTNAWPQLRLRALARHMGATILTNPGLNADYPYGTTGDWSDHVAFRKAGMPYLYFEATNWLIGDKDGYQNTTKDKEIWHSPKDTISYIEQRYPGRMEEQLSVEFEALFQFLQTDLGITG